MQKFLPTLEVQCKLWISRTSSTFWARCGDSHGKKGMNLNLTSRRILLLLTYLLFTLRSSCERVGLSYLILAVHPGSAMLWLRHFMRGQIQRSTKNFEPHLHFISDLQGAGNLWPALTDVHGQAKWNILPQIVHVPCLPSIYYLVIPYLVHQ